MSYASSRAWALKETFRGFRQNFSLFSLATFLSALALSIPLFISTIFYELAEPIRQIPTSVEITVFTKSGTDMEKLSKAVAEIETIERVSLVPKDEAIRSLNEHLGLKDKAVKHNPLPDILIATVSSSTSPAGVDAAAGRIEKDRGRGHARLRDRLARKARRALQRGASWPPLPRHRRAHARHAGCRRLHQAHDSFRSAADEGPLSFRRLSRPSPCVRIAWPRLPS